MVEWLKGLFKKSPCAACLSKDCALDELRSTRDRMVEELRDEIRYLRSDVAARQELLNRALHLEVRDKEVRSPREQIPNMRTWPQVKKQLEHKYTRKPEDAVAEHWKKKNEKMEAELKALQDNANSVS